MSAATARREDAPELSASAAGRWIVGAGYLCLLLPTIYRLAQQSWTKEIGAHGPIILATGAWLIWRKRTELLPRAAEGSAAPAWLLLVPSLAAYVFGRTYGFLMMEAGGVYGAGLAILLIESAIDLECQGATMGDVLPKPQRDLRLGNRRKSPPEVNELHIQVDRHLLGATVPGAVHVVARVIGPERQGTSDGGVRFRHDAVAVILHVMDVEPEAVRGDLLLAEGIGQQTHTGFRIITPAALLIAQ